jgi:hypothetical protein
MPEDAPFPDSSANASVVTFSTRRYASGEVLPLGRLEMTTEETGLVVLDETSPPIRIMKLLSSIAMQKTEGNR